MHLFLRSTVKPPPAVEKCTSVLLRKLVLVLVVHAIKSLGLSPELCILTIRAWGIIALRGWVRAAHLQVSGCGSRAVWQSSENGHGLILGLNLNMGG